MPYEPADDRYDRMHYRRTGRSGLLLPAISLGLWWLATEKAGISDDWFTVAALVGAGH